MVRVTKSSKHFGHLFNWYNHNAFLMIKMDYVFDYFACDGSNGSKSVDIEFRKMTLRWKLAE
jgi:hypothetical protein